MKKTIVLIVTLFVFTSQLAFSQDVEKEQLEIAKRFLEHVMKGEKDSCWQLFDKANVPDLSREQFDAGMEVIKKDLSLFDGFEMTMMGLKFLGDKQLNLYSFKAISKTRNVVDQVTVDVLCFPSSHLIAGVQPKRLIKENSATTTKGKETPLEKNFTAIIDSVSYEITGINLVHFANNEGVLAIQVKYESAGESSANPELAKKEAVKFARYLIRNGYMEKARLKANELERKLLDAIGVSFVDTNKGAGYNVLLKPDEYK